MEYTPFGGPFIVSVEKNGYLYEATIIYGRLKSSFANIFNVKITRPSGISSFWLMAKPDQGRRILWVDDRNNESILYQLIGNAIAEHLKTNLSVLMLDNGGEKGSLRFKV